MASLQMMNLRSGTSVRFGSFVAPLPAAAANRRARSAAFQVRAEQKTEQKVSPLAPPQEVESKRILDVKQYLETLPGWGPASGPFKGVWDPAGLSTTASVADVRRWRESEVTHGRVAMLAAVGFIVGEQLEDFPLFFNFDGHIRGQAIHQFDQVQQGFWEPLLISIGLAESYRVSLGWATPTSTGFNKVKDDYELGNLYFDPLGLKPSDPEEYKILQTKEINNGRLAMIAVTGFVLQELAEPGVEIFQHWFFDIEKETALELDVVEKDLGLPQTFPVPTLPNLTQ